MKLPVKTLYSELPSTMPFSRSLSAQRSDPCLQVDEERAVSTGNGGTETVTTYKRTVIRQELTIYKMTIQMEGMLMWLAQYFSISLATPL